MIHALNLFDFQNNRNKNVLEIGCGTGWLCERICLAGNQVTGLDISEEMCKASTKRSRENLDSNSFTILKGSAKIYLCKIKLLIVSWYVLRWN